MDVDPNWIESFISAVESKPCLYNKANRGYCDRDLKTKAWTEVCEQVIPGWEDLSDQDRKIKGKEIQQRWANLRHSFLRELREQKKATSGQAAKKRRKYIYFDQLLFLLPSVEERNTVSNFQPEEDEMADPTDTIDSPGDEAKEASKSACDATPKSSRRKRSDNSYEQKLLDILSDKSQKTEEIDEDKSFLLSFLPAMRRMSAETKFEAKMEIMKLMHRFEICDRPLQRQVLPETQFCRQRTTLPQVSNYQHESYSTASQDSGCFRPIHHNTLYSQQNSRTSTATSPHFDSQSWHFDSQSCQSHNTLSDI